MLVTNHYVNKLSMICDYFNLSLDIEKSVRQFTTVHTFINYYRLYEEKKYWICSSSNSNTATKLMKIESDCISFLHIAKAWKIPPMVHMSFLHPKRFNFSSLFLTPIYKTKSCNCIQWFWLAVLNTWCTDLIYKIICGPMHINMPPMY